MTGNHRDSSSSSPTLAGEVLSWVLQGGVSWFVAVAQEVGLRGGLSVTPVPDEGAVSDVRTSLPPSLFASASGLCLGAAKFKDSL